jgi:hypothetical protein
VLSSSRTTDAVYQWLAANNLTATSLSGASDWMEIANVPVSNANKLFEAYYNTFIHSASNT